MAEIVVSTDIIGVFGHIRDLQKVYGSQFKKLEMIGWRMSLDRQIKEARSLGYEIISIHGQLISGQSDDPFFEKSYLMLVDLLIKPVSKLMAYGQNIDLLFHAPSIKNKNNFKILVENRNKLKNIWIENHYKKEKGINEAIEVVNNLRSNGVRAGITFDLAHYIGPDSLIGNNFHKAWYKTLEFIEKTLFNSKVPLAFHLPVGMHEDDALPVMDRMTVEMLREFTSLVYSNKVTRLIIENQPKGILNSILLDKNRINQVKKRNEMIFEKLFKSGVLT